MKVLVSLGAGAIAAPLVSFVALCALCLAGPEAVWFAFGHDAADLEQFRKQDTNLALSLKDEPPAGEVVTVAYKDGRAYTGKWNRAVTNRDGKLIFQVIPSLGQHYWNTYRNVIFGAWMGLSLVLVVNAALLFRLISVLFPAKG